jgi:hypothetical protein
MAQGVGDIEMLFNWLSSAVSGIAQAAQSEKNAKAREEALNKLKELEKAWDNLPLPPEMKAQLQDKSELLKVKLDPKYKEYQNQALEGLSQSVAQKGMTDQDRLAYAQARQQGASTDLGLRQAAESQASQRGLGGSGSYLADLMGAQAGANRTSQEGLQAASDARQRYMQALNQLAGNATQVRGQDYNIAANAANAQDAINRFNTSQLWNADMYNNQQRFQNQMQKLAGQQQAGMGVYQGMMTNNAQQQQDFATQMALFNNFMQQSGANTQRGVNQVFNGATGNWNQMINTGSGGEVQGMGGGGGGGGGGMGGLLSGMGGMGGGMGF